MMISATPVIMQLTIGRVLVRTDGEECHDHVVERKSEGDARGGQDGGRNREAVTKGGQDR